MKSTAHSHTKMATSSYCETETVLTPTPEGDQLLAAIGDLRLEAPSDHEHLDALDTPLLGEPRPTKRAAHYLLTTLKVERGVPVGKAEQGAYPTREEILAIRYDHAVEKVPWMESAPAYPELKALLLAKQLIHVVERPTSFSKEVISAWWAANQRNS